MAQLAGRKLPLSLSRRFVGDLVHCARAVPLLTLQRRMHLADVAAARRDAIGHPGWCALFTRAYAAVAARRSELRRAYVSYPRPHLYEHPANIAAVAVTRPVGDEEGLFFYHLHAPEAQTLRTIDRQLRQARERPLEEVALFRRVLKRSRLPQPLRRLAWWWDTQLSGSRRVQRLGTFGVSSVAGCGAVSPHLLTPLTSALNYGLGEAGTVGVYLTFDQRVLDPGPAARALEETEQELHGAILAELRAASGEGAEGDLPPRAISSS
jgi:hypothetical protein